MSYFPMVGIYAQPVESNRLGPELMRSAALRGNHAWIEFWDFDSDVYDDDGPTGEQAAAKRAAALTGLAALVQSGARLAFVASAEDNYVGEPGHAETAERISARVGELPGLAAELRRPLYFWLLACRADDDELVAVLRGRRDSVPVDAPAGLFVVEEIDGRPLFTERIPAG